MAGTLTVVEYCVDLKKFITSVFFMYIVFNLIRECDL